MGGRECEAAGSLRAGLEKGRGAERDAEPGEGTGARRCKKEGNAKERKMNELEYVSQA